jgi:hypothetical protein
MGKFRNFLDSLTKSRYTCYLEQELERYRLDNQRLLNALLESHGLPHVTPSELKPLPIMRGKMLPSQWKDKLERATMPKEPNGEARP